MMNTNTVKGYDFTGKNPNEVLTGDEHEHFDEGMSLENILYPAGRVDFNRAARSVIDDLDTLLP
jgi:hypothetical protein